MSVKTLQACKLSSLSRNSTCGFDRLAQEHIFSVLRTMPTRWTANSPVTCSHHCSESKQEGLALGELRGLPRYPGTLTSTFRLTTFAPNECIATSHNSRLTCLAPEHDHVTCHEPFSR